MGQIGDAADRSNQRVGGLMASLKNMGGVLQVAAVIGGITAYTRLADRVTSARNQLRLASRDQADLNRLMTASYQIAQKNGTAFDATAVLVAKATKAARGLGMEWGKAASMGIDAAKAVSAGIRISGTGAQQAAAGILQLNQALASGVLRGDELNSVMENIPGVADALARALGTTTGQLRAMGREGELTSQKVIEGLVKARPELEKLAAMLPLTFGAAFQKVQNAAARLFTSMDQEGVGFGGALIASLELLSKGLDFAADHAEALSNIMISMLVAAAVKTAQAAGVAGAAALAQAKANDAVAASAVRAATAQLAQARSSLAVSQAMFAQGAATKAQVGANAAAVTAAAAQVASARSAATATGAALAQAGARAGLFGRAVAAAAGTARAALAAIGGPIGLVITALVGVVLWAGKAAMSFQPIADEAGTVSDYIAVAFEDACSWAGEKLSALASWASEQWNAIYQGARGVAVGIIDAFLSVARATAGIVEGIVAVWTAGWANIKDVMSGGSGSQDLRGAFGKGFASGQANTFSGVSGESTVQVIEAIPGQIRQGISDAFARSGWRDRANERANARNSRANTGGDAGPGSLSAAADDADKKAKATQRTFQDILEEARDAAHLASLTTNEAEKLAAVYAAQKELKRDLTLLEYDQLTSAVQQRQQNEANLRLQEQIRDVAAEVFAARVKSRAETARAAGDYSFAIQLEAELRVQEMLNQAKRDGVSLDAAKVEAYRQAVLLAGRENEILKLQEESRRALQAIADDARDSIRSAVSDGIYAALSGDIKGVGGFFKNLANIMRRQLAETITYNLFQKDQQARVDQLRVTTQAIQITEPAAQAVHDAGMGLVDAIQGVANSIQPQLAAPIADAGASAAAAIAGAAPELQAGVSAITDVFQGALGPLGGAISGVIQVISNLFNVGGTGNAGGLLSRLFKGASGVSKAGSGQLGGLSGALGGLGQGAMLGSLGGMIPKLFGARGSNTGAMLGGAAASMIPGIGPLLAPIGGAIGSIIGGMLKGHKTGSATIGGGDVVGGGNSSSMRKAATGAGNDIMTRLREAAKALGGGVGSFGNITIGQRDGDWRVNTGGSSLKTKKGAKDFGEDAAAALEYAFEQALKRGALTGLSAGISNAIKSGIATIEEAVDFTATRKKISLEAIRLTDPVRAAVMELDEEFGALKAQYAKFGESTVDLEKVYADRRKDAIEQALKDQLDGIRSFVDELKGGALGGQSLADRAKYQDTLFSSIEKAQAEGKAINYDELNSVGRALLDATRELEGATPAFYQQVDRVMSVLQAAITAGENPNVTALPAPLFAEPVVTALNDNNAALLEATNNQSQAIVRGFAETASALENLRVGGGGSRLYGREFATEKF